MGGTDESVPAAYFVARVSGEDGKVGLTNNEGLAMINETALREHLLYLLREGGAHLV